MKILKKYHTIHTGDRYGNWIVLDENDFKQKNSYRKILCQCQCKNKTVKYVDERNLKNGSSTSCGNCFRLPMKSGERFGYWTVLEDEKECINILCKCSCGIVKKVNKQNLYKGSSTNCGCISKNNHYAKNQYTGIGEEIIIGKQYNRWTVLDKVKSNSYLCKCSCFYHTQKILSRSQILGNNDKGCKKCRLSINHVGETYEYLTILSINEEKSIHKGRVYVNAKCKCGDIRSYDQNSIIRGRTTSCGCKKHEISSDLVGKRFGHLTVVELIGRKYLNGKNGNSYIEWGCMCDCGKYVVVRQCNLVHGHSYSCGCMKRSYGEYLIYKFLKNNHFTFEEQYKFNNCRNILPLPFDFALFNEHKKLIGLIEFDGRQHFEPYSFNGEDEKIAISNYQECARRDMIKTNYCKQNHIKLLRITYEDLEDGNWIYLLWDFLYKIKLIIDIESATYL